MDVDAHARFKSYSEGISTVASASNILKVYLNEANTFICTVTESITGIRLYNADTTSATSFTLKLSQDSTGGYGVGINTFYDGDGSVVSVYWPGGVVPEVTTTASRTDIYSFKIFDGNDLANQGIFGVITGQNFQ